MYQKNHSLTKIIATLGPACSNKETLRQMLLDGVNVCRLNFSHSSHADHLEVIKVIRELNSELGDTVAILADLQGPKLRIGEVENNGVELKDGSIIEFVNEKIVGNAQRVYMSYQQLAQDVVPGEIILIDDGKLKLEVVSTDKKSTVKLKVLNGGILSSKKGVNLPDTKVSLPSLTEKDIEDAKFALEQDVDWIALSFVRCKQDIDDLRDLIKASGQETKIIAKIEKPEALEEIDSILEVTDAIMIARGDLGVETPFEMVPVVQKQLVHKSILKGKPVVVATQMMESMISNFRPTRAEATDVANAVLDGADAVMLSGETSVGKYPMEVIRSMKQVLHSTEKSSFALDHEYLPNKNDSTYLSDSICYNACKMANQSEAKGIVVFTAGGRSAYKMASHRPNCKIFAFTTSPKLIKELALVHGVKGFNMHTEESFNSAIEAATAVLKSTGYVNTGDVLVFVGGIPMPKHEMVNTMKINRV